MSTDGDYLLLSSGGHSASPHFRLLLRDVVDVGGDGVHFDSIEMVSSLLGFRKVEESSF